MELTKRDRARMVGVHPDLVAVVEKAAELTSGRFMIVEGLRSVAKQRAYVARGASKTMNSRHLKGKDGLGHAVDIGVLTPTGKYEQSWPPYTVMAKSFKQAAKLLKIPIVWGGDWKSFRDGPHYELDRKKYP